MGCAQIKGVQSQGVTATAKHFPGTGTVEYRDAHITQTINYTPYKDWEKTQGRIFQAAIDTGIYSVMVGHTSFPTIDDTKINGNFIPATLSYKIVTELLKGKIGFKGVVVTDGLAMAGITTIYPLDKLYVELLKAGNDILLGPTIPGYIDIIERAAITGELSEDRINDACSRVIDMKEKLGLFSMEVGLENEFYKINDEILSKTKEMNIKRAENAITLICNKNKKLPLKENEVRNVVIICSSHVDFIFEELQTMKNELLRRGSNVSMQRRLKSFDELKKLVDENDLIIYAAFLAPFMPKGGSCFFGEEYDTFQYAFTYGKEKSIGVSLGSPYIYYDYFINADICVNAYWYDEEIQKAFVKAIYGEIPFKGVSSFKLVPEYAKQYGF